MTNLLRSLNDPKNYTRGLLTVMGIAFAVHFGVLAVFWKSWDWQQGTTPDQWNDLCFNLVDTHTLGFHPNQPTVMRGPLFPIMEAPLYLAFGKNYVVWSVTLLLFNLFTTYLLIITARRLWGQRAALLAGLIYGVNLAIIYYTAKISQVTSILPFVVLWFYLFTRWDREPSLKWMPWLLGLLTGLMFLNKTVYLPVPFASSLLLLWLQRKNLGFAIRQAAIYLIVTVAVVSPWTYRNYVVTHGKIIPVQNMFWELLVQDVLYHDLDQTNDKNRSDGELQDYFMQKQDAILVAAGLDPVAPPGDARPPWEVKKEKAYGDAAKEMMRADLGRLVRIKVANLWHYWVRAENWRKTKLFIAMQAVPLLAGLLGLILILRFRELESVKYGIIMILVLWGEHCVVWGWGRLSLDLMPVLAVLFGVGLDAWVRHQDKPAAPA